MRTSKRIWTGVISLLKAIHHLVFINNWDSLVLCLKKIGELKKIKLETQLMKSQRFWQFIESGHVCKEGGPDEKQGSEGVWANIKDYTGHICQEEEKEWQALKPSSTRSMRSISITRSTRNNRIPGSMHYRRGWSSIWLWSSELTFSGSVIYVSRFATVERCIDDVVFVHSCPPGHHIDKIRPSLSLSWKESTISVTLVDWDLHLLCQRDPFLTQLFQMHLCLRGVIEHGILLHSGNLDQEFVLRHVVFVED